MPVVTLHVFHEDVMAKDHAACPTVHGAEESLRDALVVLHFELDHHGCLGSWRHLSAAVLLFPFLFLFLLWSEEGMVFVICAVDVLDEVGLSVKATTG